MGQLEFYGSGLKVFLVCCVGLARIRAAARFLLKKLKLMFKKGIEPGTFSHLQIFNPKKPPQSKERNLFSSPKSNTNLLVSILRFGNNDICLAKLFYPFFWENPQDIFRFAVKTFLLHTTR